MKAPPSLPPTSPARRAAIATVGGLMTFAGTELAGMLLQRSALGALAVKAAIAEFGAGRIGVLWSDDHHDAATIDLARRAATGAAVGLLGAAFVTVFVLATGAATLGPFAPAFGSLALGTLAGVLVAVRDEMLLRGVVFRVLPPGAPKLVALTVCGLAGAADAVGRAFAQGFPFPPLETAAAAGIGLAEGVAFAALWQRDRGAWMAVAAHAVWQIGTLGPLVQGGLLDLRFLGTAWGGGHSGGRGSVAALVAALTLALVSVVVAVRAGRRARAAG